MPGKDQDKKGVVGMWEGSVRVRGWILFALDKRSTPSVVCMYET